MANKVITEDEGYRDVIIKMVGKIQPQYLRRIYNLVSYLYVKE